MTSYISISGKEFQVDRFLEQTDFNELATSTHYIGEPRANNAEKWGYFDNNGCGLIVSKAGFDDIQKQLSDAINFLKTHYHNLILLTSTYKADTIELTFGVDADFPNGLTKTYTLPTELLKLCGELKISIELITYLSSQIEN